MPIKRDGQGNRYVEMELLLPGTPEQVWHAIATGRGNAAWFTRAEIEPKEGGSFRLDFGEGVVTQGEVTAWEPPVRFAYVERDWSPGAPPCATEITITARSGDVCVMRMVHSLFTTSDQWDDEVEGFERGWASFFEVLRCYLRHFAGASAATFMRMMPTNVTALEAWHRLTRRLGLVNATSGERFETSGGPEAMAGTIERVYQDDEQRGVVLRLDAPSPGIALVGSYDKTVREKSPGGPPAQVTVVRWFYGESADVDARAAEASPKWRAWLGETFG